MDIFTAFRIGAQQIAAEECKYTTLHRSHGLEPSHWDLLTNKEYWTADQARAIRSILANTVEVSLTIAGMPAVPLPGQYVAAVIAEVVAPCNRLVACMKAPDTYDATDASGLIGTTEIKPMTPQQLMALVLAFSGGYGKEPLPKLPRDVEEAVKTENNLKRAQQVN